MASFDSITKSAILGHNTAKLGELSLATCSISTLATIRGVGTVTATAEVIPDCPPTVRHASATIKGAGTVNAAATGDSVGRAKINGVGTFSAGSEVIHNATATINGHGIMCAEANMVYAVATFNGVGTMDASVEFVHGGRATINGVGTVSANSAVTYAASATINGVGTVGADGFIGVFGSGTINGVGTVIADGTTSSGSPLMGSGTINGVGTVDAIAIATWVAMATINGVGSVSADGTLTLSASGTVLGMGTMKARACYVYGAATINGVGTMDADAMHWHGGRVTIVGVGSVQTLGANSTVGIATINGAGEVVAKGFIVTPPPASASIEGAGTLDAEGKVLPGASLNITWNVDAEVVADQTFTWDVGETDLHWYRVEGECTTAECDGVGVELNDEKCGAPPPDGVRILTVVAARNVAQVCDILRNGADLIAQPPVFSKIKSIKRYSRPAIRPGGEDLLPGDGVTSLPTSEECNQLIDEGFCAIPGCLEFCIDEKPKIEVGVVVSMTDTFFEYTMSGGITFDGLSTGTFFYLHEGDGGLEFAGSAGVISPAYTYKGDGDLIFSGEAGKHFDPLIREGSGGIVFSGSAPTISPAYTYQMSGGILFAGSGEGTQVFKYTTEGGFDFAGSSEGSLHNLVFIEEMSGGVVFSGTGDKFFLPLIREMSGDIIFGGAAGVISSHHTYESEGGIVFGGGSQYVQQYRMSGGITFGGTFIHVNPGSGGVVFGGTAGTISPFYTYQMDGEVLFGGSSEGKSSHQGTLEAAGDGGEAEVIFSELDQIETTDDTTLTIDDGTVTTSCGCNPVPLAISLIHNLNQGNAFSDFLLRNNKTFGRELTLRYRTDGDSWSSQSHFTGLSSGGQTEDWDVLFEWCCVDEIGGEALGVNVWRFRMLIKRFSPLEGDDDHTHLLITVPAEAACNEAGILETSIEFDVITQEVILGEGISDTTVFYDGIYLFSNRFWMADPILEINIVSFEPESALPRLNIKPIFPEQPVL